MAKKTMIANYNTHSKNLFARFRHIAPKRRNHLNMKPLISESHPIFSLRNTPSKSIKPLEHPYTNTKYPSTLNTTQTTKNQDTKNILEHSKAVVFFVFEPPKSIKANKNTPAKPPPLVAIRTTSPPEAAACLPSPKAGFVGWFAGIRFEERDLYISFCFLFFNVCLF